MIKYFETKIDDNIYTIYFSEDEKQLKIERILKNKIDDIAIDSIVHARIKKVVKSMNIAYVDIGKKTDAIYEIKNKNIRSNTDLLFNVKNINAENKGYYLNDDLKIIGDKLIVLNNQKGVKNKNKKVFKNLDIKSKEDNLGVIVRTEFLNEDEDELLKEYEICKQKLLNALKHINDNRIPLIVLNAKLEREKLNNNLEQIYDLSQKKIIDIKYLENDISFDNGVNLKVSINDWITLIDVNSGTYNKFFSQKLNRREINEFVFKEIIRIIKIRNIRGVVLVDILKMENKEKLEYLDYIKKNLKEDIIIHGISNLGMLEITVKRKDSHIIYNEDADKLKKMLTSI